MALFVDSPDSVDVMPSDLAKKKAAKKKEAAKGRQKKKPEEVNGEGEKPESQENGATANGKSVVIPKRCKFKSPFQTTREKSVMHILSNIVCARCLLRCMMGVFHYSM